jgi:hypothetical protein
MRNTDAIAIGGILGIIHGLILYLCLGFKAASFILYGDGYLIPLAATAIIDTVMLFTVLSYTLWLNAAQNAIAWLAEGVRQWEEQWEDELEADLK